MINPENLKIKSNDIKNSTYKELSIVKKFIFWVDVIPDGKKYKNAIFTRPFNDKNAVPQRLTTGKFFIKSNFHGYGGKSYQCIEVNGQIYLIWIDQISKALWLRILQFQELVPENENEYFICDTKSIQLTEAVDCNFDNSFIILKNNFLYGLCEIKNRDYLFSLNLKKTKQKIRKLKEFDNLVGNFSSNPKGNLFSWIEWTSDNMPWEKNSLFFASVEINGEIKETKVFYNEFINEGKNVSFFQPYWISNNLLVCSEDSTGWWNLCFLDVTNINKIVIKKRIIKSFAEYGSPQWVSGISYFSGTIKNLFCLAKKEHSWFLEKYENLLCTKEIELPFCSISDFAVFEQKLVIRGNSFRFAEYLYENDFCENNFAQFSKEIFCESSNDYSKPESFWFEGFNNQSTHAFIYKPLIDRFVKPPLIVKAHSGPTACFDGSLNSEVQYWTSKGFIVAEINYGGSSGFGREYRDRLNYRWGIVDSYDCKALALELIRLNLIDSSKVAIFGNSAGGLTAINSLCDGDVFKVAICKYPVLDLEEMHHKTHRFEKGYLNSLVGEYSKLRNEYKIRSPINKINKLTKPLLIFHGKKDFVISHKQTLKIKDQLLKNNEYSDVVIFDNEGHGFKNSDTKEAVMCKIIEFLEKTLKI